MKDLKNLYFEYLSKYGTMSLATAGAGGKVNCSTVCYAHDDEGNVIFAADEGTLKVKNLRSNPSIAATMDDGGSSMLGVQLRGLARLLVEPAERNAARDRLVKKHPDLGQFYENPRLAYVRLEPEERFLVNFSWGVDWRQQVRW